MSHIPWKLSEAFVGHEKHVLASPQVMWISSGISTSYLWDLEIFTKHWRIRELHMPTGCHSNICCIQNYAWVLLTLLVIRFLYVWWPICLKCFVKASEMSPRIGSFHWVSWTICPPEATWRRVLHTMYWSQDIHNVRQHSENIWKTLFLMKEKSSWW